MGYACKIDGKMDGALYVQILEDKLQASIDFFKKTKTTLSSNKIMTPSTGARRPPSGSKTMNMMSCYGLHSLRTSTPLSTCGGPQRRLAGYERNQGNMELWIEFKLGKIDLRCSEPHREYA